MGRPFASELALLPQTVAWASTADCDDLVGLVRAISQRPLLVVGSGGSLTACHLIARIHESYSGHIAKVLTPLELVLGCVTQASVLLISAGGSNQDILKAAVRAAEAEYPHISSITARSNAPLAERLSKFGAPSFGFDPPSGKDGFLATNSLLATCLLAHRAYAQVWQSTPTQPITYPTPQSFVDASSLEVLGRTHLTVLGAGWGWPAANDLESKFNESGLGSVVCCDYRNFAHGRHHGLARRGDNAAIVAIVTPDSEQVSRRTLDILPGNVPVTTIRTGTAGAPGTVQLLVHVFHLVAQAAAHADIDPGRPRVAPFGRRLYRLSPVTRSRRLDTSTLHITRKVSRSVWEGATSECRSIWLDTYRRWRLGLEQRQFGGLVCDYDGTLCNTHERYDPPPRAVTDRLNRILAAGIPVGVATGRGKSCWTNLRQVIDEPSWSKVLVGMYNGGLLVTLDETIPEEPVPDPELTALRSLLESSPFLSSVAAVEVRPRQLTLIPLRPLPPGMLTAAVVDIAASGDLNSCTIVESGHSVDVLPVGVSKTHVVDRMRVDFCRGRTLAAILAIGDQGHVMGNDHALLSDPHTLSVDRVSPDLGSCWHLGRHGEKGPVALLRYLDALTISESGAFSMNLGLL